MVHVYNVIQVGEYHHQQPAQHVQLHIVNIVLEIIKFAHDAYLNMVLQLTKLVYHV